MPQAQLLLVAFSLFATTVPISSTPLQQNNGRGWLANLAENLLNGMDDIRKGMGAPIEKIYCYYDENMDLYENGQLLRRLNAGEIRQVQDYDRTMRDWKNALVNVVDEVSDDMSELTRDPNRRRQGGIQINTRVPDMPEKPCFCSDRC